jgi:AhpD family alkylhydroperoxidase
MKDMETRMNPYQERGVLMETLYGLGNYVATLSIEKRLLSLLYFRISKLNRCDYCLALHSKDLRLQGETEQRL